MSDTVIIALIIAVVILAALIIFRKQLSKLFVKISKDSVEAGLETREAGGAAQAAATSQIPSSTLQSNAVTPDTPKVDVDIRDIVQVGNPLIRAWRGITTRIRHVLQIGGGRIEVTDHPPTPKKQTRR